MAADGQPPGEQPPRPRSAAPLLAREEEYRRLNAALEAKAAAVMSQAEQLMRDRREALSRPASARGDALEEAAALAAALAAKESDINSPEPPVPLAQNKQLHKKKAGAAPTIRGRPLTGRKGKRPLLSIKSRLQVDSSNPDVAAPGCSLTKLIGRIEGQLEEGNLPDLEDNLIPSTGSELGAEAQIQFLKAKLRVMQEELDAIGQECSKKELENLKRAQKQAAATQGTTDIRLNRALEEAEKYKMELNKLKQSNKDVVNQEHKKLEELKIENKRLEKQKEELVAGFKKQLKLTDILKRQKMHIESAKMLSFTEEEFMKALEWGNP